MKKTNYFLFLFTLFLACEERPEPVDPCNDNDWATAIANGEEKCMGFATSIYWNAGSNDAYVSLVAGNEFTPPYEIDATFSVPVSGLELNRAYPLRSGRAFGADELTSGSITLVVFDPPSQGVAGCIAGTFELEANAPGSPASFTYANGRFVYYRGTVADSDFGTANNTGCNPFL